MDIVSTALLITAIPVSIATFIGLADAWDSFTRRHYSWW